MYSSSATHFNPSTYLQSVDSSHIDQTPKLTAEQLKILMEWLDQNSVSLHKDVASKAIVVIHHHSRSFSSDQVNKVNQIVDSLLHTFQPTEIATFHLQSSFKHLLPGSLDLYVQQMSDQDLQNFLMDQYEIMPQSAKSTILETLLQRQAALSETLIQFLLEQTRQPKVKESLQPTLTAYYDPFFKDQTHLMSFVQRGVTHYRNLYPAARHIVVKRMLENIFATGVEKETVNQWHDFLFRSNSLQFRQFSYVLSGENSILDYLAARSEMIHPEVIELSRDALEKTGLSTIVAIQWCLRMHNSQLLELFIKTTDPKLIQKEAVTLIRDLVICEDLKLANLLIKGGLDLSTAFQEDVSLLSDLIEYNSGPLIKWAFDQGLNLDKNQIQGVMQAAIDSGNLATVKLLADQAHIDIDDYIESLGLEETERLQHYCLCSPLAVVSDIVNAHYPDLKDELDEIMNKLSLMVRFPSLQERAEVSENLKDVDEYIESSFKYAENNLNCIEDLLSNCENLTWDEVLTKIIDERNYASNGSLPKEYFNLREDVSKIHWTPLVYSEELDLAPDHFTPNRYYHAWNILHDLKSENIYKPHMIHQDMNCIDFTYASETIKNVRITRLIVDEIIDQKFFMFWVHADAEVIEECKQELNTLHSKVMNFSLEKDNQQEFEFLVARTYWLIATLCETERGTPHNAMMWLNLAYRKHDLPAPIPKLDYFFLDNIMLILPVEEAVARWRDFFETT